MSRWLFFAFVFLILPSQVTVAGDPSEPPPVPISLSDIPREMPERMKAQQRARLHRALVKYEEVWGRGVWKQGSSESVWDEDAEFGYAVAYVGSHAYYGQNLYDIRRQVEEEGRSYRLRDVDEEIDEALNGSKATQRTAPNRCLYDVTRERLNPGYYACVGEFQRVNEAWLSRNATPKPPPPYGFWDLFYDIITSPFVSWLR